MRSLVTIQKNRISNNELSTLTLGEIHRSGALLNFNGQPYKDKATISKVAQKLGTIQKQTLWGPNKRIQ